MYYSLYITVVSLVQVIGSLKILKSIIVDGRQANQFSLVTLVMITSQDGYLSILHFFFSLKYEVF